MYWRFIWIKKTCLFQIEELSSVKAPEKSISCSDIDPNYHVNMESFKTSIIPNLPFIITSVMITSFLFRLFFFFFLFIVVFPTLAFFFFLLHQILAKKKHFTTLTID